MDDELRNFLMKLDRGAANDVRAQIARLERLVASQWGSNEQTEPENVEPIRVIDENGNLRVIISPYSLLEELGISAYLATLKNDGRTVSTYVDADTGDQMAGNGAVAMGQDGFALNQGGDNISFLANGNNVAFIGMSEFGFRILAAFGLGSELAVNGDFATGDLTGWTDTGTVTVAAADGRSGFAAQLSASSNIISADYITGITAGNKYLLSAFFKLGSVLPARIVIRWYNSGSSLVSESYFTRDSETDTGWMRGVRLFTAPATAVKAKLVVDYPTTSPPPPADGFIAEISFKECATADEIRISDNGGVEITGNAVVSGTLSVGGSVFPFVDKTNFTPKLEGTTTAGTGTYTTQLGRYSRIGNIVFGSIDLLWTAHTGTGNMIITGLPLTSENVPVSPCIVYFNDITLTAVGNKVEALVLANSTNIILREIGSGTAATIPMDTAGRIALSFFYFV